MKGLGCSGLSACVVPSEKPSVARKRDVKHIIIIKRPHLYHQKCVLPPSTLLPSFPPPLSRRPRQRPSYRLLVTSSISTSSHFSPGNCATRKCLSALRPGRCRSGHHSPGGGSSPALPAFNLQAPQWLKDRASRLPQLPWLVNISPQGHQPGKRQLITVQDFFRFTEEQGQNFFKELDANGDGRVGQADVARVLRNRNLPESYAKEFISTARGGRWWSTTITWEQFRSLVDERESKVLRAYTALQVNDAGQLDASTIKGSLSRMGLEANDRNTGALMKALGADEDGFVTYGNFRNFVMLLPEKRLQSLDPSLLWFNAASSIPFGPPPGEPARRGKGRSFLVAAMAGAIASGSSTLMLHPIDTLKTRLQSSTSATLASVARSARETGARGLYRGIVPAFTGSAFGHGVRTCAYEASLQGLTSLSGGAAELQMQGLASGVGTVLGTCIKIPCDLLKQRLQVGRHANVVEALAAARKGGGLYRGTAALLAREVPFYALGMVTFEQLKRVAQGSFRHGNQRELASWEVIAIGAVSGAIAAVLTTPADVVKTRIMTAAVGEVLTAGSVFKGILANEGVPGLFRGALPRAIWTAPQGAMHFAGYELAKQALAGTPEHAPAGLQHQPASLQKSPDAQHVTQ